MVQLMMAWRRAWSRLFLEIMLKQFTDEYARHNQLMRIYHSTILKRQSLSSDSQRRQKHPKLTYIVLLVLMAWRRQDRQKFSIDTDLDIPCPQRPVYCCFVGLIPLCDGSWIFCRPGLLKGRFWEKSSICVMTGLSIMDVWRRRNVGITFVLQMARRSWQTYID